jgi:hypothetical protein
MEQSRTGKSIACNTRELREIARDAHKRGLNRQLTPAQFKLLDPKGTHILSPQMYHDKADGKPVEEHIRVYAHVKLIGKQGAIEKQLDVTAAFIAGYITDENAAAIREYSIAIRSIQDGEVENPLSDDEVAEEVARKDVFDLGDKILDGEIDKRKMGKA